MLNLSGVMDRIVDLQSLLPGPSSDSLPESRLPTGVATMNSAGGRGVKTSIELILITVLSGLALSSLGH